MPTKSQKNVSYEILIRQEQENKFKIITHYNQNLLNFVFQLLMLNSIFLFFSELSFL